jgi:hypothetical protein
VSKKTKISVTITLFFNLSEQTCTAIEADRILNVVSVESQMRATIFILCIFNMIQSLPKQHNSNSKHLRQIKCPSYSGQNKSYFVIFCCHDVISIPNTTFSWKMDSFAVKAAVSKFLLNASCRLKHTKFHMAQKMPCNHHPHILLARSKIGANPKTRFANKTLSIFSVSHANTHLLTTSPRRNPLCEMK